MTFADGTRLLRSTRVCGSDHVTLDLMIETDRDHSALQGRIKVSTEAGPLFVVSREDLIAMKVRAGRAQDLADIERLRDLDR